MKRVGILALGLAGLTLLTTGGLSITQQKGGVKFDIAYLDDITTGTRSKLSATSGSELTLDDQKDAYVLSQNTFNNLSEESAEAYLNNGGVIVVNDNEVSSEELKKKIDTKVIDFDYSGEKNQYGFYVYNDGEENVTVNVALGFLGEVEENTTAQETKAKAVADVVEESTIVESIVSSATSKMSISPDVSLVSSASVGGGISSTGSGKVIATAYLENILYLESNKSRACSYTVYTKVTDVAKVKDSSGKIRGVYDVTSTFTLDAESKYAITNYSVRMQGQQTILDASYLNSNTSTTVSLGGSLGFQGDVINGSLQGGVSYTYNPDSQEIVNDLPVGNNKYWKSNIIQETYDASYKIIPSIRIMNSYDGGNTREYSRVESFYVKDNGWWIFQKKYYMKDKYRKELGITWNSSGYVSQHTYTG